MQWASEYFSNPNEAAATQKQPFIDRIDCGPVTLSTLKFLSEIYDLDFYAESPNF